jgi:predicted phage terminase large subunit-like protein
MIAGGVGGNIIVGSEPFPFDDRATRRDRALLILRGKGDRPHFAFEFAEHRLRFMRRVQELALLPHIAAAGAELIGSGLRGNCREAQDFKSALFLEVFFVLEVIRERLRFDDLRRKILEVKRRYGAGTLLIEESPISKGLIQSLEESSINVTKYAPDTDKLSRLITQCDLFKGGSVRLPKRAPWLEDFMAELLAFPGRHDDQVDALTQGLAWGRLMWSHRVRSYRAFN